MKGVIEKVFEIYNLIFNVFMLQQFENFLNFEIYRKIIVFEIWNDINGNVDIFVVGVGIGGIIIGVGEVLKEKKLFVKVVVVEFFDFVVLLGEKFCFYKIQGIGVGFVLKVLNIKIYD